MEATDSGGGGKGGRKKTNDRTEKRRRRKGKRRQIIAARGKMEAGVRSTTDLQYIDGDLCAAIWKVTLAEKYIAGKIARHGRGGLPASLFA